MRALIPRSGGFRHARFLPGAAFSGVKHNVPSPLSFGTSSLRSRSRLALKKRPSAGPGAEARRDRMTGPGTKRTSRDVRSLALYRGKADKAVTSADFRVLDPTPTWQPR
jgi:hypothetical protein